MQDEKESKFQVKIEKLEGNELVIRQGAAAEMPPLLLEQNLKLTGTFESLVDFAVKRSPLINPETCHITTDYKSDSAKLVINDKCDESLQTVFSANLKLNSDVTDFGINTSKTYSIKSLMKFLKMRRPLFADRTQQESIIRALNDFEGRIEVQFKTSDDFRGNTANEKIVKCTNNLPLNFNLKAPVYVGYAKEEFLVEIEVIADGGEIKLELISLDLIDVQCRTRDEAFQSVKDVVKHIPIVNQ